jgi:hypothetical protein
MRDSVGKLPEIKTTEDALKEILLIAKDKRHHVLLKEDNEWLELKMKVIQKFAKQGLKLIK